MNADMEEANSLIRKTAMPQGYVVVQPSEGSERIPSWTPDEDYIYVYNFIMRVMAVEEWNIDSNRIHFTGFSQGGSMSWRFLCEYSDLLASAGPAASGNPGGSNFSAPCFENRLSPAAKIPIMFLCGEEDAAWSSCLSILDNVIAGWNLTDVQIIEQSQDHRHTRYSNGDGYLLEFLQHTYQTGCTVYPAGHCFPGGTDITGEGFWLAPFGVGLSCPYPDPSQSAFVWGEKIVEFFNAHPKSSSNILA